MIIKLLFSLCVGLLSGFLYAFLAYRSCKLLFWGQLKPAFWARYALVCFRLFLLAGGLAGMFWAGLIEPVWTGAAVLGGYVSFYMVGGVMRWM